MVSLSRNWTLLTLIERFRFFNSQSGRCEQFSFGSCGGNANNFMDQTQCELKCQGKSFIRSAKHNFPV